MLQLGSVCNWQNSVCVCVCVETHSGLALVWLKEGKREESSIEHVVNNIHDTLLPNKRAGLRRWLMTTSLFLASWNFITLTFFSPHVVAWHITKMVHQIRVTVFWYGLYRVKQRFNSSQLSCICLNELYGLLVTTYSNLVTHIQAAPTPVNISCVGWVGGDESPDLLGASSSLLFQYPDIFRRRLGPPSQWLTPPHST